MTISRSKIVITGGAGFIGTTLAFSLADDNEIILFDNLHNCAYANTNLRDHKHVRLVEGDVLNAESLRRALEPDTDYVIHAAAIAGVDTVIKNPLRVLDVNVKGTFNVAEAAVALRGLKKFVLLSTSEVYGENACNASERDIRPTLSVGETRWAYAASKIVGEFIVHAHSVQNGMSSVTLRPFNIYGPNQVGVGAIHHFVKSAIAGDDLIIYNDGSQVRAWCYIDDFVRGALLAMSSGRSTGQTYNIGNPRCAISVYDLARMVVALAKSNSRIVFEPAGYADIALRIPDISAAQNDLGFEPDVDLENGLRRTIEWYGAQRRGYLW